MARPSSTMVFNIYINNNQQSSKDIFMKEVEEDEEVPFLPMCQGIQRTFSEQHEPNWRKTKTTKTRKAPKLRLNRETKTK